MTVVSVLSGAVVEAQPLLVRTTTPAGSSVVAYDLTSRRVSPSAADDILIDGMYTADGQFALMAIGGGRLRIRHVPSASTLEFPIDFRPVVADPGRVGVFGLTGVATLARLDLGGVTTLAEPCGAALFGFAFAPSSDGRVLYTLCPGGSFLRIGLPPMARICRASRWTA